MRILSGPEIDKSIGGSFEDPMPWTAIAKRHDADLILVGKIVRVEISNQKIVGALSGKLNFDVSIWDPARDEMGYQRSFEVVYPTTIERGDIVVTFEQTEAEFRRKLFAEAAKQVKRQLCGALEDSYPE
ncbi:MAG: hypothetical protein ACKVX7_03715 [Planctomycetota bacterium]